MLYAAHLPGGDEVAVGRTSALDHASGSPFAITRRACQRVAPSETTVALIGEAGTGKELLARFIHENSARASGPFVAVSCAQARAEGASAAEGAVIALEAELLGHAAGALPGVNIERTGRLAACAGGTLFVDEIGALPLSLQVKLVRILQDRCYEQIGGTETLPADFRLVVGSDRDLSAAVESGRFRRDLYYMLFVCPIRSPPLRERPDDIPILFRNFWVARGENRPVDPQVITHMISYPFPGNIRELENLVGRIALSSEGPEITVADLPDTVLPPDRRRLNGREAASPVAPVGAHVFDHAGYPRVNITLPIDLHAMLRALENAYIDNALAVTGNNKKEAAHLLGMGRTTLVEKLRRRGTAGGQEGT